MSSDTDRLHHYGRSRSQQSPHRPARHGLVPSLRLCRRQQQNLASSPGRQCHGWIRPSTGMEAGIWYRMKLSVEIQGQSAGPRRIWQRDQEEGPRLDARITKTQHPTRRGVQSYAYSNDILEDSRGAEVFFYNVSVTTRVIVTSH